MCLILVAWQMHPDYPLVVAANRDEFFARPTAPAQFWTESPDLLAGRDLQAGGTWLGITRQRRFAALTNFREGGVPRTETPSRGALVGDFLSGSTDAQAYLSEIAKHGGEFNGFNLVVGDGRTLAYYANRGGEPQRLPPGIYGLSNHLLDTPWPKLVSAKAAFAQALDGLPAAEPFFALLADREIVPDESLPNTGIALEWERCLSAIFVSSPHYGTRASTLLTLRQDGLTTFVERSFGAAAATIGEVSESFYSAISTGV